MPEEFKGNMRCKFCKWSKAAMVEQESLFEHEEPRRYLLHICHRYTGEPLLKTQVCELFELEAMEEEEGG